MKWFAYDIEEGFQFCKSEEEAKAKAKELLAAWDLNEYMEGEPSLGAHTVCWGLMNGRAVAEPFGEKTVMTLTPYVQEEDGDGGS